MDENNKRVNEQADLYKRRQAIVEHPFGTIKRAWGYSYTLLRGLSKVDGEMHLIALVYNLRRALNILGFEQMMKALKTWTPKYHKVCCALKLRLIRSIYSLVVTCCFFLSKTYAAKQVA